MSLATTLYDAHLTIAGHPITWREILGNGFGFASAVGGLRRRVWAWPVGIVGNVLLFTVFIAATFEAEAQVPLFGQAGRQVFFIITSIYGWWRWQEVRRLRGGDSRPARDHPALGDRSRARRLPGHRRRRHLGAAVGLQRRGRRLAGPALVLLVRRVDLRRLDARDLRDGPRLERLLADVDRRRPGRRAAAVALAVLPDAPSCSSCTAAWWSGASSCGCAPRATNEIPNPRWFPPHERARRPSGHRRAGRRRHRGRQGRGGRRRRGPRERGRPRLRGQQAHARADGVHRAPLVRRHLRAGRPRRRSTGSASR